jgi:hypothetical protein
MKYLLFCVLSVLAFVCSAAEQNTKDVSVDIHKVGEAFEVKVAYLVPMNICNAFAFITDYEDAKNIKGIMESKIISRTENKVIVERKAKETVLLFPLEIHTTLEGFQNPHLKPKEINRIMGTFKAPKTSQSGGLHNFFYTPRQKAAAEPEPEPELRDSDPSKTAEPAPKSYLDGLMESFFGTNQIPSINCTMEPLQGSSNAAAAAVPIISGGVELVEDSKV